MTCYKDRIWCNFGHICKVSNQCDKIPTDQDREEARKAHLPLAYYTDFPDCFVRFFEPDKMA